MRRFGFGAVAQEPAAVRSVLRQGPVGGMRDGRGRAVRRRPRLHVAGRTSGPAETTALLNRFYEAAVDVLCRHAIIDKLVGDQVMALYLPQTPRRGRRGAHGRPTPATSSRPRRPSSTLGVGLDYGTAFVGNVGSGEVKDFTAIGDVVNTAARLQAAAGSGEIVLSRRVQDLTDDGLTDGGDTGPPPEGQERRRSTSSRSGRTPESVPAALRSGRIRQSADGPPGCRVAREATGSRRRADFPDASSSRRACSLNTPEPSAVSKQRSVRWKGQRPRSAPVAYDARRLRTYARR